MIGRLVRIHNSKDWPQYEGKVGTVVKDCRDGDMQLNLDGRHNVIVIDKTQVRFEQSGGAS